MRTVPSENALCAGPVVIDPRSGLPLREVTLLPRSAVSGLAEGAAQGFRTWSRLPVAERGRRLRLMADTWEQAAGESARSYSNEHGKTLAEASAELNRAVETIRWNAVSAEAALSPRSLPETAAMARTLRLEPIGPVLAFVPWNFPAVIAARKVAAALAMGCSVTVQASERTPEVLAGMQRAARAADIPAGVLDVVHAAAPIAAELVRRPEYKLISFTGSTRVGRLIAGQASGQLTPCVLELGGHAPAIVTDSADLALSARVLAAAKHECAGQSCGAPSRLLVHHSRYDEFVRAYLERVPTTERADPANGTMGPLNNAAQLAQVHALVQHGIERGGRALCGGNPEAGPGYYYPATLLAELPADAAALHEEPFGPLATIQAYESDEQAIALANSTAYGLNAYVFGTGERAQLLARELNAGVVTLNAAVGAAADAPLGGRDGSGYGCEGGMAGLAQFAKHKLVQAATG